jgi:hypothetical protein
MADLFIIEESGASGEAGRTPLPPGASWTRLGTSTLVQCPDAAADSLVSRASGEGSSGRRLRGITSERLRLVVQQGRLFQKQFPSVPVLLDKGRFLVVDLPAEVEALAAASHSPRFAFRPLPQNAPVFEARGKRATAREAAPSVQAFVDRVDEDRCRARVEELARFHTRHSFSDHYRTAAAWTRGVLSGLDFVVREEEVVVGGEATLNVIAERAGSGGADRRIVMATAHLDSVNHEGNASSRAPGADDNASGSAGILEIAEALRDHRSAHDLQLVLFGGEEQGLYGSLDFVARMAPATRARIVSVINMDMIARRNTQQASVLLEGAPLAQPLLEALAEAAATYTSLQVQTSLNPFNSDHVPFLDAGIPAVLTIEGTDSANTDIHTDNDTIETLNFALMAEILRLNVATIAEGLDGSQ